MTGDTFVLSVDYTGGVAAASGVSVIGGEEVRFRYSGYGAVIKVQVGDFSRTINWNESEPPTPETKLAADIHQKITSYEAAIHEFLDAQTKDDHGGYDTSDRDYNIDNIADAVDVLDDEDEFDEGDTEDYTLWVKDGEIHAVDTGMGHGFPHPDVDYMHRR